MEYQNTNFKKYLQSKKDVFAYFSGKQLTMTTHNSMKLVQLARARTIDQHKEKKNFCLEHLYKYHCYMETLKIMKLKCPVSICNLLVPSLRDSN